MRGIFSFSGSFSGPVFGSLVVALLSVWSATASAAPTVSLTPSSAGVTPATQLDVHVVVNGDMPALGCYSFSVTYNSVVLDLTGASEGPLFANTADPTFFATDTDALGRNQVSACILGFGTSVTGPGEIATLHFDVLAEGTTSIDLVDVVVRDVDRAEIPGVVVENANVVVGATGVGALGTIGTLVATPNPSPAAVQLALRGGSSGVVFDQLEIYDAAGRRVRTLPWGVEVTRTHWDGRDAAGERVAAGLYFAILRGASASTPPAKILRIR